MRVDAPAAKHRTTALAAIVTLYSLALLGIAPPPAGAIAASFGARQAHAPGSPGWPGSLSCDRSWLGGASVGMPNDWWNPANWSPQGVPTATDNVCVTSGDSPIQLWDKHNAVQTATVASLTLGDPSGAGAPMTVLMTADCPHQLTLSLGNGGTVAANAELALRGQRDCTGSAVTVAVSGGTLVSAGTISATLPSAGDPNPHDFLQGSITNAGGVIKAVNPMVYSGSALDNAGRLVGSTFLVDGGTFTNDAGGTVSATELDVVDGTFNQGDGSGAGTQIYVEGGSLNYTGQGAGTVHARGSVVMSGTIGSAQSLVIESLSDCDELGDATVTAGGFTNFGTITLTNAATSCNPGSTTLVVLTTKLINRGVFTADPGTEGGDRTLQGSVLNSGTVSVLAGTQLTISGSLANYHSSQNLLDGGGFSLSGTLAVPGIDVHGLSANVSVSGNGVLLDSTTTSNGLRNLASVDSVASLSLLGGANLTTTGPLDVEHDLTLGPTDTLTLGGGYTQGSAGALTAEVSPSGMGQVNATAGATVLAGKLVISAVGGFVPAPGSTFSPVAYGSETGEFSSILGAPIGDGDAYVIEYEPSAAVLVVRTPTLVLQPTSGPAGSQFTATGDGFSPGEPVGLSLKDVQLQGATADASGHFAVTETVPDLTQAQYTVTARGFVSYVTATRLFTIKRGILNGQFREIGMQLLDTDPAAEHPTTANTDEAMDFNDTSHLLATYQEGQYADGGAIGTGYATSFDDGGTWSSGNLPGVSTAVGGTYPRAANPRGTFGPNGQAYVVSQVLDPAACLSGLAVNVSVDGGLTWADPTFPVQDTGCGTQDDMTGIAVDTFPASPFFGRIYVVWDRIEPTGQPVMVASSPDGGATWSPPVQVTPAGVSGTAPTPLVQPNGDLTVYYPQPAAQVETVQTSPDGGATFGAPVTVSSFDAADPPGFLAGNGQGMGDAAVDPVTGDLYVVWPDRRYDNWGLNAIVMSKSTDGGATWVGPLLLSGAPVNPIDRFTPGIGAYGGYVAVTWYHLFHDSYGNLSLNRGFTYSGTNGATWSKALLIGCHRRPLEFDLTEAAQIGGLYFFGNYQSVVTTPAESHPVWTVSSAASTDYNQVAWTATMRFVQSRDGPRVDSIC